MAKIISISDSVVSIGTDDGGLKEVRLMDLNFTPVIGDEVEIFETETKIIITKKEVKQEYSNPNAGININVSNANNTGAPVYVANGTKAVNKVVYCLLAFFLGAIGVHKFYAGKIGTGVVFLLFCWTGVPAIIALIDLIIGICKKADDSGNILV